MNHGLAQFEREELPVVKRYCRENDERKERSGVEEDAATIMSGDGAVDGGANHPGQHRELEAAQDGQGEEPVPFCCVGLGIGEDAPDEVKTEWRSVGFKIVNRVEVSDRLA